ncbi:O-antigen polymerase [Aliarcobacter butzleri]|uniref:O-antigen polymerase n=1 Tax=Aliarcobacter butzleri TaxID=28197 RepID=UPI002B24176A|nr:O-antigen polymerase [Aliarcobacter butzleri]
MIINIKNYSFRNTVLSVFSIFSFYYFINYILNPMILIFNKDLKFMLTDRVDDIYYINTILIGIISWIIIYFGYKSKNNFSVKINKLRQSNLSINLKYLRIFSILSIILFITINFNIILDYVLLGSKVNLFQNSNGNGIFVTLSSLFIFVIYYYSSCYITKKNIKLEYVDYIIIFVIMLLLLFTSMLFESRRNIAVIFFIFLLTIVIIKVDKKYLLYLLVISIISSIFITNLLQIFRSGIGVVKLFDISFFYQTIISSYEGHWLSVYLSKTDLYDIIFGVNMKVPFDNLINFIPRSIWSEKPYNLGILEIQSYLVPKSFDVNGVPIVTLPSTILVEIFYSFGILFGIIIMYYLGKLFRFIDELFKENINNPLIVFIFVYSYINMFNFVRSGSAFLITILIPILFCILIVKKD